MAVTSSISNTRVLRLVDTLRDRATGGNGFLPAYTYLEDGEAEGGTLSWADLDRQARAIAAHLGAVTARGERALLLFPAGLDFIAAFFGCLYAGVVAVPCYPPRPNRGQPRLRAIVRDSRPAVVLTSTALSLKTGALVEEIPELAAACWLATDGLAAAAADDWRDPRIDPDHLALLQYTSGSTASPKGVMVSHGNLIANERMIQAAFRQSEASVVVGWLPLYHDMGLIGNVLQPLWSGGRCVLMSPVAFLQKPLRWLAAISRYAGTTSGGPNFAYELCAKKIGEEERVGLDLSRWEVAYNGAEPVRPATLDRFAAAFASCGFRREAFYPCYGLAEATLFAAGGDPAAAPRALSFDAAELGLGRALPAAPGATARELASCGHPYLEQELAIVDPQSRRKLPSGAVGEIWIAGPNVAAGYWDRPEASAETFAAFAEDGAGPYLRTGDLGFLSGGELFVAGRRKDLIILRGRNLYPQDLEATAESAHAALRPGCGAAFSVELDGEERLALVYEMERRPGAAVEEIAAAVRAAIAGEHEAQVADLVLVKVGGVPKTSSGKVQRHACRAAYLDGTLAVVARSAAAGPDDLDAGPAGELDREGLAALPPAERRAALEAVLRSLAARALGCAAERIERAQPLAAYGLDSLAALELRTAVEERLGVALPLATLFEGATLGDLATLLASELEDAAAGPLSAASDLPSAPAAPEAGEFPLSYGQEGLWVAERLSPEAGVYNLAGAFRAATPEEGIDPRRLREAVESVVARHPGLRLRIRDVDGAPRQRVAAERAIDFLAEEARGWTGDEVLARLAAEAWRPFDLAEGPLVRVLLLRGAPGGDVILFVFHHSTVDFASLAVLAREIAARWGGEHTDTVVAAAGDSYADFVHRQRIRLAGPEGERLRAFWRERLDGELVDLDLPADRPRPPEPSFRGLAARGALPREVVERLEELARASGATLQAALLAGWSAYLHRLSGQDGFVVGLPAAGRFQSRFAETVGYFVNPVAVRALTQGDPGFGALLARMRDELLGALEHAEDPFPRIAAELRPVRDPSRAPLFQTMLVHHAGRGPEAAVLAPVALGAAGARLDLGGLRLVSVALPEQRVPFDLTLRTAPGPAGELGLALEASADLFDRSTTARLLDQFSLLLAAAARAPRAPETAISALPLLREAERHQLLAEWNDAGDPRERSAALLDELVEPWERATPDALAVADASGSTTYRELRARSLSLACRLRSFGVAEDTCVALCLDRSADLVVAALAAMRAGGAYAPIDPAYPEARRADMVAVAGARAVVTLSHLAGAWCDDAAVICLDRAAAEPDLAAARLGLPPLLRDPEQLAYVVFTSGSTGRPKGVGVSHRGAVHIVSWHRRHLGWTREDRGSQISGVSFDAMVFEIWPALAAGASLHVVPSEARLAPAALLDWLAREQVTVSWVPTPIAEVLLAEPEPPGLALRYLHTGGDRLHGRPPAGASYRLKNQYGPAENSVVTTAGDVPAEGAAPAWGAFSLPTIGRPLDGVRVHLLDRALALVPRGVPGELFASGRGLARGYLGDPAQTAERFLPDPFSGVPGSRMYRTGDLARFRPDGEIDFLGRIDTQIKIRGQRIELGEIEAALVELPAVREAAVLAHQERPGAAGRRLVAYVVLEPGAAVEDRDLVEPLQRRLTEAMVPRAFVRLERLPTTANDKVDRRALAALAPPMPAVGETEPRTETEARIAGVWAEILGLERVGIEDDFFALGGHSLLAARLAYRLQEKLGVEVPVRALFEAPTVARLAERLGAAAAGPSIAAPPLERVGRGRPLPPSFAQQRIWFLERLEPGLPTYHVPGRLTLRGELDPAALAALAAALDHVVARHEALRTGFVERLDGPAQEIAERVDLALPAVDLGALPADLRRAEADRLAALEARRPFDLERPPLLRALRLALGPADHELILTLHHIVSDGWSLGLLADELGAAYGAFRRGEAPRLPALAVQAADAAVWERRRFAAGHLDRESRFWAAKLAGEPAALDLPLDGLRPSMATSRGGRVRLSLAAGGGALDGFARRRSATPFMVLAAAWAAVLARFGGRDDLLIGTPVSVRTRPELEALIGCFVNTIPLRADLGGDPPFAEIVDRLRAVALEAYAHRHLPYERLVEQLRPGRQAAHAPLFQAFLVLEEPPRTPRLEGLAAVLEPLATDTAKFDLTLALERNEGLLAASLEFARDLFDAATAERLLAAFTRLFGGGLEAPEARLSELPLLSVEERDHLLAWSGAGKRPAASGALLHERFERWAAAEPEREALVWREERWTYGDLERRSRQIAARLLALGVEAEERVAVCLTRSAGLVAALLGVLRAGAAYVPIDPAYPAERVGWMVEDAQARVLVTERRWSSSLAGSSSHVVLIDEIGPADPAEIAAATERAGTRGLAYVIYTSGSTGRPKGVAIEHASASALVDWAAGEYSREELSGVLAATSVCFDLSVFELFVPLSLGGRVIVAENALELATLPARQDVRLVNTVPSAIAELVRAGGVPPSVRTINLAGEALPRPLVDALYALPAVDRVANLYGPSEDTTYSTWEVVPAAETIAPGIGVALPGTRSWVVDRQGAPAPAGVPGELCLAGTGLARGYLGRPELTAERFVPEPWGGEDGARMYRTGDLVRYRKDGRLEFLGRIDHQVKVRGFRVELGEVEAQLLAVPGVREAAVVADAAAGRLIAYVVRAEKADWEIEDLREALAARLPGYMVPALWIELERLPRTPNGKLDRKALPKPEGTVDREAAWEPPQGRLEARIAELFGAALERSGVGRRDDFFALGGHSLLASRVIFRLREELGWEVPLLALFEAPTAAGLAGKLEALRGFQGEAEVARCDRGGPLPVSHAQERIWFLEQLAGPGALHHIAAGFEVRGVLSLAALAAALSGVAARHESLRTRFRSERGHPVAEIAPPAAVRPFTVDLAALPPVRRAPEAARTAQELARQPFDLTSDFLLRAWAVRHGGDLWTLGWVVHHLVCDGASLAILEREISELYAAALERRAARLPELDLQPVDLAAAERNEGADLWSAQVGYWRIELADLDPLALPADRPRPAQPRHRGRTRAIAWRAETAEAVARLARSAGTTPTVVALAGFAAVLARWSGQQGFGLGVPAEGRWRREAEGLVGLFINTLAVRADTAGDPAGTELLGRLGRRLTAARAHGEVPFERLVKELAPERDLGRSPWFQVMVASRPASGRGLTLPGAELSPAWIDTGTSKLDLTLFVDAEVAPGAAGWGGALEYDADLFDPATIERLVGWLERTWESWGERPEQRLSELPLEELPARRRTRERRPDRAARPIVHEEPVGELETRIAALFGTALGRSRVGRHDDFFTLGGHSLLASRVIFELREELGREVPLAALFEAPTVARLAAQIDPIEAGPIEPIDPAPRGGPLPLSFAQERIWFLEQLYGPSALYHMAAAYEGRGRLDIRGLAAALDGIWSRHEALRARFDPGPAQRFAAPAPERGAPWLEADLTGLAPEAAERAAGTALAETVRRPFDLARGPLLRAVVVRQAGDRFRLALVVHHLVADGVSLAILERELAELAAAAHAGRPARLPAPGLQPADIAVWQRSREAAGRSIRDIEHWRATLAGLEPLDLPADREHPARVRSRGRTRPIAWRPEAGAAVAAWARSAGATSFAVALAGFAAVLARWSGQETFGLGVPVDGRWRRETAGLVGLFVNTLVVRADAAGDPTGAELLARLGSRLAEARAHGAVPFERLVEELAPERDLGRGPWFQVMVASRPASGRRLALPDVELAPAEIDTGTSKFDLTLFVDAEAPETGWSGALEYDADRFEPETIERLVGWIERAWESWSERPELRLSELPLGELPVRRLPRERRPVRTTRQAAYEEPQGVLEARLAELFGAVLGRSGVGRHDDFFALGGHSLLGARVIFGLRAELGWEVPLAALFEAPTVAGLAAGLAAAGPQERIEPVPAVPRDGALPLSFAQERLWFLEQLEGPSPLYHVLAAFDGAGRLDPGALRAALSAVESRHEALRARFTVVGGHPVQTFAPPGLLQLAEVDLSAVAGTGAELDAAVREVVLRPFDLERGPLLRVVLLRGGAGRFRLVLVVHHLVADGVSLAIVERELGALYRRALGLEAPALPPLALQHADVALWQRGRATGDRLARWIAELAADPAAGEPLELPVDRPRPAVSRHHGETREIAPWLDGAELGPAVSRLAGEWGATAYQIFFAAFGALVGRLARRESFLIGLPVSGRTADSGDLVGLFADTRVVRVDLAGDPAAAELIARVRAGLFAAETRGDVPFERLVEALAPARSRSFSPLYQVSLVARPASQERLELPGLDLRPLALSTATAKRDLTLFVDPQTASAASGTVEYDADLFEAATIQRWMGQLGRLIADMAARPEAPLSQLRLLSGAERHQLVAEWNRAVTDGGLETEGALLLDELFDPWEAATPTALAVADASGSVTYRELGARANRLAWHLRSLGVAEESRVAICLDRSVDLVVAELAALRAGGAYAPIDPAYPEKRRADMAAIAGARVVITLPHLAGDWCGGAAVVEIDRPAFREGPNPGRPPRSRNPDRLAYAMFTSGSTGRPKGVGMSHRGALHIVTWHRRRYGWSAADRGAQVSGPSFDAAVNEIWPALGSGASLHVPPPETRLSPAALMAWFARERVTVTWTPTPIAEALLAEPEPPGLALRFLQTGGDRLHRRAPAGASYLLNNHYGPVENAVLTTEIDVPAQDPGFGHSSLPTIGRPLDGTRVYLLDRSLALAPWGAAGELVAGGRGVARGYLGDPAQTAERFVPDPYSGEPGSRMYRTGDLVRFRRDGEIDFIGRIDTQVKIRGQRIELGEIEAALTALPGVREAAVLVREDGPGGAADRRLVAYVALEPGREIGDGDLVEPLRQRLTDAMVPRAFVRLERLPATTNGKVDRRALAAIAPEAPDGGGSEPGTETETRLAAIWAELLGLERVRVEDDFFALGGHSLLAARAAERVRREFGVELPLATLFDEPTLAGLARQIDGKLAAEGAADAAPAIGRADRALPLPLSFAQERLWLLDRLEPGSAAYTIPAALALCGRLDGGALSEALCLLAARHESLRTTFALVAGQPVQRIADRGDLPLPWIDLRALPAARRAPERDRLYALFAALPFDLALGPLARLVLVALAEREHALLLALHHSIADGWSIGVLVRDLAALYGELASGRPAMLPALAVQVADHAVWQRGELAGERLTGRLAWWHDRLGGAPPALELPLDRPRPPVRSFRGARRTLVLAPELADALRALARSSGATLFMTLLAAFELQLGRLAGQSDLVVGTPAAERARPELEPLIGMFLNTIPLRADLSGSPGLRELVGRVRSAVLEAFARELPFELLLDELRPERDPSRTPLFQVFFNMLNLPAVELSVEGLELSTLAAPEMPAKFDLTVYAGEREREIWLEWVYNADLFDAARIAAMLDQYQALLAQGSAEPDRPGDGLSLVPRAALAVLPDPRAPLSGAWAGSVQDRFAAWAAQAPERLAVADPREAWTYGELEERSNRLAWRLSRDGVGKGDVVAILGHRSARLAWAVLGTLKAGAVFTILDPAHPPARLADTLQLARPRGFVALAAAGRVPAAVEACLDGLAPASRFTLPAAGADGGDPAAGFPAVPEAWKGIAVGPDDLAYVSFTSGSTGVPKGILGRHGPLSHFVPWQERTFGFGPDDRYSMLSGLAHDPLQRDLFTPLQTGAAVVAPDPADLAVPGRLAAWLRDAGVTVAHLTPAMGQILCQLAPGEPAPVCDRLRWAFYVGDVLTRRDVARLAALAPNVAVVNYYGSTETQRSVGFHRVADPAREAAPATQAAKQSLPLGRGIEDVQLLVLGRAGQLAGIGELGEILVRGPHLAAGYLGDPEGTEARFTANPLSDQPGDRVYRTGDLGRYLPDGEVEPAGRADAQVKIRGFRIEPGEVEAWLGRHPAVRECVVVAREQPASGERRLVAYAVLTAPAPAGELRAFLKERLPDFMVPASFVFLEKLPVNPNGKVDRQALPESADEPRSDAYTAPQTEIERMLAAILREVLGVEKVSRDDNFFELGGNSLQLVKVQARVQETLGTDLQVVQLFTHPTVAALASLLSRGERAPSPAAVVEDRTEKLQVGRDRLRRRREQRQTGEESA